MSILDEIRKMRKGPSTRLIRRVSGSEPFREAQRVAHEQKLLKKEKRAKRKKLKALNARKDIAEKEGLFATHVKAK